jgi:hypothetical protein
MNARMPTRLDPDDTLLAQELTQEIRPWAEIAPDFGMSVSDIETRMASDPQFATMVRNLRKEWTAISSTKERIRAKARVGIELLLPEAIARGLNKNTHTADLINVIKTVARLGDLEPTSPTAGAGAGGPGVSITLNFGSGAQPRTVNGAIIDHDSSGDPPELIEDVA